MATQTLSLQTFACIYMPEDFHFGSGQATTELPARARKDRPPPRTSNMSRFPQPAKNDPQTLPADVQRIMRIGRTMVLCRPHPNLRRGPNRAPSESGPARKLIKEKRPTYTPVWYRAILLQASYYQYDRHRNCNNIRSTREAELHRSRCIVPKCGVSNAISRPRPVQPVSMSPVHGFQVP
jgi:hypothetical protein